MNAIESFFQEANSLIPPAEEVEFELETFSGLKPTVSEPDPLQLNNWHHKIQSLKRIGGSGDIIGVDDANILDGAVRISGIDALAFYKSRRYKDKKPYRGKWGIFYLEKGILRIKNLIEGIYQGRGSALNLAVDFLREHERYHLKFDLYALSIEAALKESLYEPLKFAYHGRRMDQVEEALANRDAFVWSKRGDIELEEFAYDFMKVQPGAYARFDENQWELSAELAGDLFSKGVLGGVKRRDQMYWVSEPPKFLLRKSLCPEYVVCFDGKISDWFDAACSLDVKSVIETTDFKSILARKYRTIEKQWHNTKRKLVENPRAAGLNFKPWSQRDGIWSVRVNDNFRAHLRKVGASKGEWHAEEIGPHTAMGHG